MEDGLNSFAQLISMIDVCLPLNVNPHVWSSRIEKIVKFFDTIKESVDKAKQISTNVFTAYQACDTYSMITTLDVNFLAFYGRQIGMYVTFSDEGKRSFNH